VPRLVRLTLIERETSCIAELFDAAAPVTCDAIWGALPLEGPLWHTKTAGNEVYTLLPAFSESLPLENGSLIPIPGDLLFFGLPAGVFPSTDPRCIDSQGADFLACIASFYDRNSIHWMELGFVPGTRWGGVIENLDAWRAAGHDVWRNGCSGERLRIEAVEQ
jgi:hypothetical protein